MVPAVSVAVPRRNCTTAPFEAGVFPTPLPSASSSDLAVVPVPAATLRQLRSLAPTVQLFAQVVAPKIARVSVVSGVPVDPLPAKVTATVVVPVLTPESNVHPV